MTKAASLQEQLAYQCLVSGGEPWVPRPVDKPEPGGEFNGNSLTVPISPGGLDWLQRRETTPRGWRGGQQGIVMWLSVMLGDLAAVPVLARRK